MNKVEYKLQYKRYAERAILIQWPSVIEENVLYDLLNYKRNIENESTKAIVEVISSYNSLLILYISTIEDFYSCVTELKWIYKSNLELTKERNKVFEVPVCYDLEIAPDLSDFLLLKNMTLSEFVRLHTDVFYKVYGIGFLPGFLYLGGLENVLSLPRKSTPSLNVKKGSVAIGGNQTGIYPMDSPGGWHVVGMTPLRFFDPMSSVPCFAAPGDKIQFVSIEVDEYYRLKNRVDNGYSELNYRYI